MQEGIFAAQCTYLEKCEIFWSNLEQIGALSLEYEWKNAAFLQIIEK